ncbi:MAG: nucleotide exchange factor GrpE [Nitrospiria bacterium]
MIDQEENKAESSEMPGPSQEGAEESQEGTPQEPSPASEAEPGPASEEERIARLQTEIEKKNQAAKEAHERYLRALADHENYKKRVRKEQFEQAKFSNERLLKEILPVIDNLERALSHSKEVKETKKIVEGVKLIHKQLLSVLEKFDVRPIESLNKPFDPFHHQSVGQVDSDESSEIEDNHVIEERQKGYFLNERVLRPALVIVSKKNVSSEVEEKEPENGSSDTGENKAL